MSRTRRFIIAVTVLACVGAGWIWWRSRTRANLLAFRSPAGNLNILASHRGGLVGITTDAPFQIEDDQTFVLLDVPPEQFDRGSEQAFDPTAVWRSGWGFKLAGGRTQTSPNGTTAYHAARVPFWAIVSGVGFFLLLLMRKPLRQRRWVKQGWCAQCGYDLRESPGGCPECGAGMADGNAANGVETSTQKQSRWRRRRVATAGVLILGVGVLGVIASKGLKGRNHDGADTVIRVYRTDDLMRPPFWDREPRVQVIQSEEEETHFYANVCFNGIGPIYPYVIDDNQTRFDDLAGTVRTLPAVIADRTYPEAVAIGDRMIVALPPAGHREFVQLLATLRNPAAATGLVTLVVGEDVPKASSSGPQNAEAKLDVVIPEVNFDGITFEQAVDRLREATHANIVIDQAALDEIGFDRGRKVKVRLWDVTLHNALRALLAILPQYSDYLDVSAEVDEGLILISTREKLVRRGIELRVYDLRSMLVRYRASDVELYGALRAVELANAPKTAAAATRPTTATTRETIDEEEIGMTREEWVEVVATFIKEQVDVEGWLESGGTTGVIREFGSRLVVSQTPANHREIERVLKLLFDVAAPVGPALTRPTTFPAVQRLQRN